MFGGGGGGNPPSHILTSPPMQVVSVTDYAKTTLVYYSSFTIQMETFMDFGKHLKQFL